MVRIALKLAVIFLLVTAGVYFGYGRLEKELLSGVRAPGKTVAEKKAAPAAGTAESQKVAGTKAVDYQIIVKRNIFQAALDSTKVVAEEVVEEVVPTTLNLTLLGTVTGSERDARAIIIDNKARQQDIYQIGDAVQGAFIESIERGKITLDVNGKIEALLIKDREGGGPGPPSVPASESKRSPAKSVDKNDKKKIPRVRPNRRISFRQDSDQAGSGDEELENLPGNDEPIKGNDTGEPPGLDEMPRE